jgi:hypothetical protein
MVLDIQTVHHILKNTAVQNVNKLFVYITDLTSTLNNDVLVLKIGIENSTCQLHCKIFLPSAKHTVC